MTFPIYSTFKPDLQYTDYPQLTQDLDSRMKPGICSEAGFITKKQNLSEVCQKDSAFLKKRGITHEQIADRLEAVLEKAQLLFKQTNISKPAAIIEGTIMVPSYSSTCGEQQCPFSEDLNDTNTWCGRGTSSINIINLQSGKCLNNITELHAHLIRDHHFFEGNTEYRLDPATVIDVLEIAPGVDYQLKTIIDRSWQPCDSHGKFNQETLDAAREYLIEYWPSNRGAFEAYLLPYYDWHSYKYRGLTNRQKIEKEGLEQNKSREEIDKEIEQFIELDQMFMPVDSRIDEQVWRSDETNYLHVFTFKKHSKMGKVYNMGNVILSSDDIGPPYELTIFRATEKKIIVLENNDRIDSNTPS